MADPILPSAPIDQFEEYNDPIEGDFLPIVDTRTTKTKKINTKYFFPAPPSTNYAWVSTFEYAVDNVVEHQGLWYKSLISSNVGNNPKTSPASWEQQNKSQSGFVYWQAGVFTGSPVIVLRNIDGYDQLLKLVNPTRPFLSSNFELEFTQNDWELMSERGYMGTQKTAHGLAVNDVVTFKSGNWNKYADGDTPLGLVRSIVSLDAFIILLFGSRVKNLSGLTPATMYYIQAGGTIDTVETDWPTMYAISSSEAILLSLGFGGTGSGPGPGPSDGFDYELDYELPD